MIADTKTPDQLANELTQSFGETGQNALVGGYAHPKADNILAAALDVLGKIETGERLIQIYRHYNIPVKVLKGTQVTFNSPDERTIYMTVPLAYEKSIDVIAMCLGCAIRDVEQAIVGYGRPSAELDPVEFASITYTKALDIIKNMCQIADELKQNLGYKKAIDKVFELGHGSVYEAYKAQVDEEQLFNLFVDNEFAVAENTGK